jgi:ParB family chromosome partitioning protein
MATRKALGRGLSALIPSSPPAVSPAPAPEQVEGGVPLYISVARIAPNPRQPRKSVREDELTGLAASIREQGVLQPLVVRRRGDDYELIIGERRWRACQLAGLDEVPAVVLDATDRGVLEMALVENVQRADLNPIELASAFKMLIETEGMTQEEVGRRVGLDRSSIANHLRVLELDAEAQQDLIDQKLTMGHAKALLQVPSGERGTLRQRILRGQLAVRDAEELARRVASKAASKVARPGPTRDVHVVDLENRMRRALQTKIRIIGRRTRGRIELHYFGEAELERLSDRLLGSDR